MPNRSSHADHVPERSCVICKKKIDRSSLLKFVILKEQVIFDLRQMMSGRGFYICSEMDKRCLEHLDKWLIKKIKKRLNRKVT